MDKDNALLWLLRISCIALMAVLAMAVILGPRL